MRLLDIFTYSFSHLQHRGLRTWLTLLGIVVGISSVILLVGIVDGISASIEDALDEFGSNIITITPGGTAMRGPPGGGGSSSADKLYLDDVKVIEKVAGVETVSPIISVSADVEYRDYETETQITGVNTNTYLETNTFGELEEGRFLEPSDKNAVLLGYGIVDQTFKGRVGLNSKIQINGTSYKVVGILEEEGGMMGMDNSIFIPIDGARELAGDTIAEEEVSQIKAKIADGYNLTAVTEDIEWALMNDHNVDEDEKDFTVISAVFMEEQRTEILETLTLFVAMVSSISLIVGGIGISNTMFMSVLERTREIGVLKALGATSNQIQNIFLAEAAMIGLAGGVMGIAVGWGLLEIAGWFDFPGFISIYMVGIAFSISVGIGIIAGTYPAREATKIPAIEALRYE